MMSDALWQDHQIAACAYHGGMSDTERAEVQLRWATNDSCKVLYCTVLYCTVRAQLSMVLHNATKGTFIQTMQTQCL